MRKEDLIAELQKINGNPVISIGINKPWGKISYPVINVTPLYAHDGHKVDSEPIIFEITADGLEQKIANLERGNKNGNTENRQQVSNQEG